jgi:hypothetical protein
MRLLLRRLGPRRLARKSWRSDGRLGAGWILCCLGLEWWLRQWFEVKLLLRLLLLRLLLLLLFLSLRLLLSRRQRTLVSRVDGRGRPSPHLPLRRQPSLNPPPPHLVWLERFGLLERPSMGRCSTSFR